ncbi:MAG: hypothetical protein K8R36_21685 [Planctomycetales bacterium]|nr:hypothetical protein [Planctomycetales bacterium]
MNSDEPLANDPPESLRAQYEELAALTGSLAHEIKNPLSVIRMNMELLAEDFADSETPRERRALSKIDMVTRQCTRLENLLNDFLHFNKVRKLQLHSGSLNEQIERVLELFTQQAKENGVEIVRYLDHDLPSFEPFYSTKSGGSGLGLPTARKIIEAHGGRIGVHSEVGRGTQFTLEFPTPPRIGDESEHDPEPGTE